MVGVWVEFGLVVVVVVVAVVVAVGLTKNTSRSGWVWLWLCFLLLLLFPLCCCCWHCCCCCCVGVGAGAVVAVAVVVAVVDRCRRVVARFTAGCVVRAIRASGGAAARVSQQPVFANRSPVRCGGRSSTGACLLWCEKLADGEPTSASVFLQPMLLVFLVCSLARYLTSRTWIARAFGAAILGLYSDPKDPTTTVVVLETPVTIIRITG